jgi:hypothetical protein
MREAPSEQCGTSLFGVSVGRKPLQGTVVCGDRIGDATVPKGGRAGSEFIRTIRVQSGDRWVRHG